MNPDNLPLVLPVIPLPEPLLLPGTVVPVVAEESPLRDLVRDAFGANRYVGILQPREDGEVEGSEPRLYTVGCLGHIDVGRPENPDEFLIGGVIRFRVIEELPPVHGYRRMRVDYGEFLSDLKQIEQGLEFTTLRDLARRRVELHHPEFDFDILDRMVGTEIATALAYALPFSPAERQALMEAPSLQDIQDVLLLLMSGSGPSHSSANLPVC